MLILTCSDTLGKTSSVDPTEEMDLSIERLCIDLLELIQTIFPTPSESPSLLVRLLLYSFSLGSESKNLSS